MKGNEYEKAKYAKGGISLHQHYSIFITRFTNPRRRDETQ